MSIVNQCFFRKSRNRGPTSQTISKENQLWAEKMGLTKDSIDFTSKRSQSDGWEGKRIYFKALCI